MNILLRDVDPVVAKKFEEKAKKSKISRDKLLNSILTKIAYEPEVNEREKRLEYIIAKNIEVMELMMNEVEQLRNEVKNLRTIITDLMEE